MSFSGSDDLKASDLHLSSDELIAVMNEVKSGRLSVDQALSQVRLAEQKHSSTSSTQQTSNALKQDEINSVNTVKSSRKISKPKPPLPSSSSSQRDRTSSMTTATTIQFDEDKSGHRRSASDSSLVIVNCQLDDGHTSNPSSSLLPQTSESSSKTSVEQLLTLPQQNQDETQFTCVFGSSETLAVKGDKVPLTSEDQPAHAARDEEEAVQFDSDMERRETLVKSTEVHASVASNNLLVYPESHHTHQRDLPETAEPVLQFDSLRRVTLTHNTNPSLSRTVLIPNSIDQLVALASKKLSCDAKVLFNTFGGVVDDIAVIRDDDVLFVSEGEPFRPNCRAASMSSATSMSSLNKDLHWRPSSVHSDTESVFESRLASLSVSDHKSEWIRLNVGGTIFCSTRSTLTRDPDSMLAIMFSADSPWNSAVDDSGAFLIDRNPDYFKPLLAYLRDGVVLMDKHVNPQGVLAEAHFFGLHEAAMQIEGLVDMFRKTQVPNPPISRNELVRLLIQTPSHETLRCQGMSFTKSDLSRLDLRNINFKFASLKGCNLTLCNFENCNFEEADLTDAVLDGSNLKGCHMPRVKLDRASLRNCNFHDSSQLTNTNMEGASAKSADFEDSNLSCTIMRASSLKDANFRNCNLRCVNLAGADMARCNLTGCNLQGANLRGSNTTGTHFHNISSAVHMSQVAMGPVSIVSRHNSSLRS